GSPLRVPQRIVLIGISVWPSVDGDGSDIACWIESCWRQHATEFVTDVPLKRGKGRGQQLQAAEPMLLARRQAWLAGRTYQPEQHGRLRRAGIPIMADTDRFMQADGVVEAAWRCDGADTKLVERRPMPQRDIGVDERHLGAIQQRLF